MKRVLLLGGSGFVGRHVCQALNRAGIQATVLTRRLPARSVQTLPLVTVVQANVLDPMALQAHVHGHDAVINLVAMLHGHQVSFDQLHVQLPRQLAQACIDRKSTRLNSSHT